MRNDLGCFNIIKTPYQPYALNIYLYPKLPSAQSEPYLDIRADSATSCLAVDRACITILPRHQEPPFYEHQGPPAIPLQARKVCYSFLPKYTVLPDAANGCMRRCDYYCQRPTNRDIRHSPLSRASQQLRTRPYRCREIANISYEGLDNASQTPIRTARLHFRSCSDRPDTPTQYRTTELAAQPATIPSSILCHIAECTRPP